MKFKSSNIYSLKEIGKIKGLTKKMTQQLEYIEAPEEPEVSQAKEIFEMEKIQTAQPVFPKEPEVTNKFPQLPFEEPSLGYLPIFFILMIWMCINVATGLPIIFTPSMKFFSAPYISLITGIVCHTIAIRKFHKHLPMMDFIFSPKTALIAVLCLLIDIFIGTVSFNVLYLAVEEISLGYLTPLTRSVPIILIILSHFVVYFYLFSAINCFPDRGSSDGEMTGNHMQKQFRYYILKPVCGMELLLSQLLFSIYFAILFDIVYEDQPYLAEYLCIYYPMVIGIMKAAQEFCVKEYDVEVIYEYISLGLAAFPYKFLFFSVDLPIVAAALLVIKFGYKFTIYFVVYLP